LDPGFAGEDGRKFATTPLGIDGAVLQRVLLDEAIEVFFQFTGHFGRATGAGASDEALGALVCKTVPPLSESGIGERERVGDGVQAVPFDHFTDGVGTTEDTSLFRLFQEGI
jgi:hypothetical protein